MKKDNTEYVWEDLRPIGQEEIFSHFPNIAAHCKDNNYDVTKECIPVVPAQHYFMGGIKVDYHSKTTMEQLYAIGETACNGVHGKNRLASNSLLESLVFAKRAAAQMTQKMTFVKRCEQVIVEVDLHQYADVEKLQEEYRQSVRREIEKMKTRGEEICLIK